MGTDVPTKTAILAQKRPPLVHTSETTGNCRKFCTHRPSRYKSQLARQAAAIEYYKHQENDPESEYFHGDHSLGYRRSEKLRHCRKSGYAGRHKETGLVRQCLDSCKLRWCALCGAALVSWRSYVCSECMARWSRPRVATFTLEHSEDELVWQIKCLYRSFRNLRRLPRFRKYVQGGLWFPHIKRSSRDGLWHSHLHVPFDGIRYPHDELVEDWCKVTRGSTIVYLQEIQDPGKVANDVVRYSANPCDWSKLSLEDRDAVRRACHGRQMCGAWGTAKGVPLQPPKSNDKEMLENVGSISAVLELRNLNPNARAIYEAIVNQTYLPPGICLRFTDDIVERGGYYQRAVEGADYGKIQSKAEAESTPQTSGPAKTSSPQ